MLLRFIQDEVLSVMFQRKILFHNAMKVRSFASYQKVAMTSLLPAHEVEYLLLRRAQFEMRIE
jgi:hypothetical protein